MAFPAGIVPLIALIPIVAVVTRRRRIVRKFEEAGADHADRARTLAELDIHDSHTASHLARSGLLATADGDRYFLCVEAVERWRRRRKVAVITALSAIVVLILMLLVFLPRNA